MFNPHEMEQIAKSRQAEWENVIREQALYAGAPARWTARLKRMFAKATFASPAKEKGSDPFSPANVTEMSCRCAQQAST